MLMGIFSLGILYGCVGDANESNQQTSAAISNISKQIRNIDYTESHQVLSNDAVICQDVQVGSTF